MTEATGIAVVIPNWNGAAFIDRTIDAVLAQHPAPDVVVVVDDASTDDSVTRLRARGDVQVIARTHNGGYGAASNEGVRAVDAERVVVLNSDAVPDQGWLAALLAAPATDDVWAWGSVLVDAGGRVESAADHLTPRGNATRLGRGLDPAALPVEPYEALAPPGASPMVRRSAFLALGGYEERYFAYCEDVDLAVRARLAGWRALVVPDARVVHGWASSTSQRGRPTYWIARNSLWCAVRLVPALRVRTVLGQTRRELAAARVRGDARSYLRGRLAGLRGLPWALRTRRALLDVAPAALADLATLLATPRDLGPVPARELLGEAP